MDDKGPPNIRPVGPLHLRRPLQNSASTEVNMTFPQALEKVMAGSKVTKQEWGNTGIYVCLKDGFIRIIKDGKSDALMVSEGDLIGTDWMEI